MDLRGAHLSDPRPDTWAIEYLSPLDLLQGDYDGIVKDILQAQQVDRLISDRETIKEMIFTALKSRPINIGGPTIEKKYGVEVVSFVLKETRFGDKLVEASEEKKRRELIAEADNYAADQEASRIRNVSEEKGVVLNGPPGSGKTFLART